MEIVLEGDADPAVQLHALVDQLGAVVPDEGLGGARELVRVVGVRLHGGAGDVTDGVTAFEPGHHVGEAVLQRLVRARGRPNE